MVLGTSTVGYALGALQVDYFAALPTLEVAKIMIQGPALGGLFAVAAYLMAERAIQDLAVPPRLQPFGDERPGGGVPVREGVLDRGRAHGGRGGADRAALRSPRPSCTGRSCGPTPWPMRSGSPRATPGSRPRSRHWGPTPTASWCGAPTTSSSPDGAPARCSMATGAATSRAIQKQERGWFASRDGEHKVVAFLHRPGLLPDGDGAVFVAVSPLTDYASRADRGGPHLGGGRAGGAGDRPGAGRRAGAEHRAPDRPAAGGRRPDGTGRSPGRAGGLLPRATKWRRWPTRSTAWRSGCGPTRPTSGPPTSSSSEPRPSRSSTSGSPPSAGSPPASPTSSTTRSPPSCT